MNLNTLNNQFYFQLPLDFIPADYDERYMKMLSANRKLYSSVIDYLNSSIQSISFPSIKFPLVSNPQVLKRKMIKWKSVGNIYDMFDDSITVTFANVDSNLNYIMMLDCLMNHYLNVEQPYDKPLIITVIDRNRKALYHIQFRDVIWTGMSENQFAFNDQVLQNKTFTATFAYNFIDFEYVADKTDIITGNTYGTPLQTE